MLSFTQFLKSAVLPDESFYSDISFNYSQNFWDGCSPAVLQTAPASRPWC